MFATGASGAERKSIVEDNIRGLGDGLPLLKALDQKILELVAGQEFGRVSERIETFDDLGVLQQLLGRYFDRIMLRERNARCLQRNLRVGAAA